MVYVTEAALDQFQALRDANTDNPSQGVALVPREDGELAVGLMTAQEHDEVFERDGRPVLIIPEILVEPMEHIKIDYVIEGDAQGFTLETIAT